MTQQQLKAILTATLVEGTMPVLIKSLKDQLHGETNLAKYYALQERLRAAVKKLNQILNN